MHLSSSAFEDGGTIPERYTRMGENKFPPLKWSSFPAETKGFALLVEDPDAPKQTFRHCLLVNIPENCDHLDDKSLDRVAEVGAFALNDFGNAGYDGPEPPREHGPHRYHFRLAALQVPNIKVDKDADATTVWAQVCVNAVEMASLTGTYERH